MSRLASRCRVLSRLFLVLPLLLGGSLAATASEPRLATLDDSEVVTQADLEAYLARGFEATGEKLLGCRKCAQRDVDDAHFGSGGIASKRAESEQRAARAIR